MERIDFEAMRQTDIKTVDKTSLVDIGTIKIDKNRDKNDQILQFMQDVKNPYCFLCEGIIVKSSFCENGGNLQEKMVNLISRMYEE